MATSLDRDAIRDAYTQVMEDNNGVEWSVFLHTRAMLFIFLKKFLPTFIIIIIVIINYNFHRINIIL